MEESFSTQHEHQHSYCYHPEPTLHAPGFLSSSSNLEAAAAAAAMAYVGSSTSSLSPLLLQLQLQGSFHPSEAEAEAEAAAGCGDKRRMVSTERSSSTSSSPGSAQEMDGSGGKTSSRKHKRCNVIANVDDVKNAMEACGEPPDPAAGYIHVRARRGQATDRHSIAERVRRERISEKMKMLQSLVPGCAKVTGKALMLDEIISYVQSLQNQVVFLSMRLASLDPMMLHEFALDFDMYPDASQLLKMAAEEEMVPPHELVQCMGQQQPTGAEEEAQGPTWFAQDGGSSHMMQQELNNINMCFLQ